MNRSLKTLGAVALPLALFLLVSRFAARTPIADDPSRSTEAAASPPSHSPEPFLSTAGTRLAPGMPAQIPSAELLDLEKRALAALPTIAEIQKKSADEVHETPTEIREAGRKLGDLAEFLAKNPAAVRDALPTYQACAGNSDVMPALRGVCAYRLKLYEKEWDDATRAAYAKIPAEIRELAKQLEGT